MRSRALCRGKVSPRCVPGRQSVAIFSLHVSQKGPRTGKSPLPGKIRTPCIRNELALARYARHVSEKPRKPPSEDTPREDLARKGHLSLHGPLESCAARESCHPPPNSASDRNHGAALMGGGTGRGRLLVGRGDAAKGVRGVVGCRALAAKPASVKLACKSLTPTISPNLESQHSRGGFRAGRRQGGPGQAAPPSEARVLATSSSAFKEKVNPLVLFMLTIPPGGI